MVSIREFSEQIRKIYEENDYPSDRLIRDTEALAGFVDVFNSRIKGSFSTEEIAAEIERIRKDKKGSGGLPRLGRSFHGPRFFK